MCKHLGVNCPSTAKTISLGVVKFPDRICQVYIFTKTCSPSTTCYAAGKAFLFDSEHDLLMKEAHNYPLYVALLKEIADNQTILFITSIDNIHIGFRFADVESAKEFFKSIKDFQSALLHPSVKKNHPHKFLQK